MDTGVLAVVEVSWEDFNVVIDALVVRFLLALFFREPVHDFRSVVTCAQRLSNAPEKPMRGVRG